MVSKIAGDWSGVQIPTGLKKEVQKYLKSSDAKKRGFVSVSAFVSHCIREQLESRSKIAE